MSNVQPSALEYPYVSALEAYWSLPAITRTRKDQGVIAHLVTEYGGELVLGVIKRLGVKISAANSPLQYLVGAVQGYAERESFQPTRPAILNEVHDPEKAREAIRRLNKMSADLAAEKAL